MACGTTSFIIISILFISPRKISSEIITEGFLESMMNKIKKERLNQVEIDTENRSKNISENYVKMTPEKVSEDDHPQVVTKEQMMALYQAAVMKGADLHLLNLTDDKGKTELKECDQKEWPISDIGDGLTTYESVTTIPGYYYYFYPIENFHNQQDDGMMEDSKDGQTGQMTKEKREVAPLFLAMASFVGIAMMLVVTILSLPKIGRIKSRHITSKEGSQNIPTFTKHISKCSEGKNCQCFTCEVEQAIRTALHNGQKKRLMERLSHSEQAKESASFMKTPVKKKRKCINSNCEIRNT